MQEKTIKLQWFRYIIFPLFSCIEIVLISVLLVSQFFNVDSMDVIQGYKVPISWIIISFGLLIIIGFLYQFLSAFQYKRESSLTVFLTNERTMKIIGFSTIFLLFCQIVTITIVQLYYTFITDDVAPLYLTILIMSFLPPGLFYFMANFETDSEKVYALSKEAPLRLKLTALWLIFLTAVMQIFASSWEFLIIGLLLLIGSYLFYNLYRNAVVITPTILIIHFLFSTAMAVASFILQEEIINDLLTSGEAVTPLQATLMTVFVFIIPGLISILLAQSFFRKWVLAWIRDSNPEPELEIELEMAD